VTSVPAAAAGPSSRRRSSSRTSRCSRAPFLVFYLLCGVAAALAHVATSAGSAVLTVGASGAVSGVLGAYLVLFPRKRVRVLTVYGVSTVPAVLMLGLWILIQLASGLGSMGQTARPGASRTSPTSPASWRASC
jgi:membrane associated rhomboid family serine protease